MIIPPQPADYEKPPDDDFIPDFIRKPGSIIPDRDMNPSKKHWIICLITSRGFGRSVSDVDVILQNTELALADLKDQLAAMQAKAAPDGTGLGGLNACQFNSGLFGVDWAYTKATLERSGLEITVIRPAKNQEEKVKN